MSPGDTEVTRRALLDATRALLEQPGGATAGVGRIAAEAGFSRQAVYRHFGSRAGLLEAVLADVDEQAGAAAAIEEVLGAGDPSEVLAALVEWWSDYVEGFAGIARGVYAGRAGDPALAAAWEDRMEALMDVCRLVAGRCADAGQLRDELSRQAAAELLWGLLSIPLWDQLVVDRGWSRSRYRRRLGLAVRATLLAPG